MVRPNGAERRFDKLPIPDRYNLHVILTNRIDNYHGVKLLTNYFGISIITIDNLLSIITDILTNNINSNPILSNPNILSDNISNDNDITIDKNNITYQNYKNEDKTLQRDIYECVVYYFLEKNKEEHWLNG